MDHAAAARDSAARAEKAIADDDTELATAEALTGLIHAGLAISASLRVAADPAPRVRRPRGTR